MCANERRSKHLWVFARRHSANAARGRVFAARAVSNAVVVGGNTLRRDDPRLTARRPGGGTAGHAPLRVVMSRTLDLPPDAALWETGVAPTVVATQAGARRDAQATLASRGRRSRGV